MRRVVAVAAAAVAAVTIAAPIARAQPPARGERSQPKYGIGPATAYHVQTRWGTIYGEVVRPVGLPEGTKVPVILTISPYNALREPNITESRSPAPDNEPVAEYFVPRGYARAVFDVLGTHSSTGCYDFAGVHEREAAAAVVDFLGDLPWTNGKVGTIGISYDGDTQLEAAVQQPRHLAAVVAQAAVSQEYDNIFWGGVAYSQAPVYGSPATYDFVTGGAPQVDRSDPAANIDLIRSRADACDKVEHNQRAPEDDPVYDQFWADRDFRALAGRIKAPTLLEAGWLDTTVPPLNSTRLFDALPPNLPKRLSAGLWDHGSGKFEDSMDLRQAWFDQFLLGLDTGVLDAPPVDTQPINGERHTERSWPPAGTKTVDIALVNRKPAASDEAGIVEGEPSWTDSDPAYYGYEILAPDAASLRVAYQTAPLTHAVRISGAPLAQLRVTSTETSTHFCLSLAAVSPDATQQITFGLLNSRNRNGLDVSEPVVPGRPYAAPIDTYDTDMVVPAGFTLYLTLTSSCAWGRSDRPGGSTNTILDGSYLRLPVSEGADAFGH